MERPATIPCPANSEGCKYAPDCTLSTHHQYPRRLVKELAASGADEEEVRVARRFINLPYNKVVACRMIHDYLDTVAHDSLPSHERMERAVNG